mgnify:CR=1 FL=1
MKCPQCQKNGSCRYLEKRPTTTLKGQDKPKFIRTNFMAKCNCGFEGEVK